MSAHGTMPKWLKGDKSELCGCHDCHVVNEHGESVDLGSCRRCGDLFYDSVAEVLGMQFTIVSFSPLFFSGTVEQN